MRITLLFIIIIQNYLALSFIPSKINSYNNYNYDNIFIRRSYDYNKLIIAKQIGITKSLSPRSSSSSLLLLYARTKQSKRAKLVSPFEDITAPIEVDEFPLFIPCLLAYLCGLFIKIPRMQSDYMSLQTDDSLKLPLTKDNVDIVLNEIRPFLATHGGNVELINIDLNNSIVELQLIGTCSSCASSEVTLRLGIENRLKSRLKGIDSVRQIMPTPPDVSMDAAETFLNQDIVPLLNSVDVSLSVISVQDGDALDLRSIITLKLANLGFAVDSIKEEIVEKLVAHFLGSVRVIWSRDSQ